MHVREVIIALERNREVFVQTLSQISEELIHWKNNPKGWSLLEIICHLIDEEEQDFRARVLHTLKNPESPLIPIDPVGWVLDHNYAEQDFERKVEEWNQARKRSIQSLKEHEHLDWDNKIIHPQRGAISARSFLFNWLAHDYHHIRQINRIKYDYLKHQSGDSLTYAGNW